MTLAALNVADWNVLQAAAIVAGVALVAAGLMIGLGRRAAAGIIGPRRLTLELDADDFDAVQTALGKYQTRSRWSARNGGGVMVPEGESDLAGAIIGEICRDWLEQIERNARR